MKISYCLIILMILIVHVRPDFTQDKKECQDQLVSLSPCITFVTGDDKAPTPICCSRLKENVEKSKLCLCILVKDRDEPSLGFKLNATLALALIPICHIQTSTTVCTGTISNLSLSLSSLPCFLLFSLVLFLSRSRTSTPVTGLAWGSGFQAIW